MKFFIRLSTLTLVMLCSVSLLVGQTNTHQKSTGVDGKMKFHPKKVEARIVQKPLAVPLVDAGAASPKSITGNIVSNNGYQASSVNTLSFTLNWSSPDYDYIDYISMTFPTGITPTAAGQIDGVTPVVSGQQITWGTQVTGGSGYGPIDLSPVTFSVTATVGALTGNQTIAYYIESDQYAQTSPWSITANCTVAPAVAVQDLLWDNMLPYAGRIVSSALMGRHPDSTLVQSGDDFLIATGYRWTIDSIHVAGAYSTTATTPADSFTVEIWSFGSSAPDSMLYTKTLKPAGLATATSVNLDLPDDPEFDAGHYWVSVYAVYNSGTGFAATRWNWDYSLTANGSPGMIRDETGLFGIPPFGWTTFTGLGVNAASTRFSIHGTDTILATIPDAGLVSFVEPDNFLSPATTATVKVILQNFGTTTLTSVPLKFAVDGGTAVTATYTGTLAPNATDTFVVGTFTVPSGNLHNLCAWTDVANDGNHVNDTVCMIFNEAWTKQFHFMVDTTIAGQAGAESDGFSIFTTVWNSNTFVEYDLLGNLIGTFTIPGVTGVRDLAYDGKYFYGSNAAAYIWQMDFHNKKLVATIPTPGGALVRAIAYDYNQDAFWINNWSTPLQLINRSGASIATIQPGAMGSFYGSAYEDLGSDPTYWGFSQDGSGSEIAEVDITTGLQTGLVYDVLRDVPTYDPAGGIAGGLFAQPNVVQGKWSLGGLVQGEAVFCYEIGTAAVPMADVGVHSVDGPSSACGLGSTEAVVVTVRNYAYAAATNFPVTYVLDGGTPVTQTITDTLAPGEFKQINFTSTGNFSTAGNHTLIAYTGLSGDVNHRNDTAKAVINNAPAAPAPYSMGFEATNDYSNWRIFDVNNDGSTWQIRRPGPTANTGVGYAQYSYNATNTANDWLLSTCLSLEASKTYKLSFWYAAQSATYPEKLKAFVGNSQDPTSMSTLIVDLPNISNTAYLSENGDFTVPTTGIYYIGFQAVSDPDMWNLYVDDIAISDVTGLSETEKESTFMLYPNPAKSTVNITAGADILDIRVSNSLGQQVIATKADGRQHTLNIGQLCRGIYLVQVETTQGISTRRLIISE